MHWRIDGAILSADGYRYACLHALRDVAGLVWMGKEIPRKVLLTGQDAYSAKLFNSALAMLVGETEKGWFSRLFPRRQEPASFPFLHLVAHSDAEGCYVPIDFPALLSADIW